MTFISYAQNLEDVLLWRALHTIENGFYIDVGANDPVEDSVTKAFYDRGWHGINIEPLAVHHELLRNHRPRDINLAVAAGATEGELTLFDVPSVRGWASPNESVALQYKDSGYDIAAMTVQARPLADICAQYAPDTIHFLKVDVEGFEADVIRGMDFRRWRPWIVVVEATMPNSQVSNHEAWEPMLTQRDYRFVYFDGLNRYYVADERADLAAAFASPPNVFDEFQPVTLARALDAARSAGERAERAEEIARKLAEEAEGANESTTGLFARIKAAEQRERHTRKALIAAQDQADELQACLHEVNAHLHAIYSSKSWRLAAPLRGGAVLLQHVRRIGRESVRLAKPVLKRGAAMLLRRACPIVKRSPSLMKLVHHGYIRFPALFDRLKALLHGQAAQDARDQARPSGECIQDVPPAWGGSISLRGQFMAMLTRELEQRKKRKH